MIKNSYLLIDTAALRENLAAIRDELKGAKLVPVIKNDAYGLGAVTIARELLRCGVDTLAVSHVSEGLALRAAGIEAVLWTLSLPLDFQLDAAAEAGIVLPLGSFRQFEALREASLRAGRRLDVQLKLDTGLHRIGFLEEELEALADKLLAYAAFVRIVGTFSQFSEHNAARMDEQFERFLSMTERLKARGIDPGLRHISCSASFEMSAKYNLDAVRLGRRLYMDNPEHPTGRIREVASFRAYLSDVRCRKAGEALSYENAYRLQADTRVGVLSVGYGDGLDLKLFRHHAPVLINGERARLLASCMDQCFVDLGDIECRAGDEVTFFGYDADGGFLSSQYIAELVGADEGCSLTGALSPRVERVIKQN